jgi:spore germination protein KA
VREGGVRSPASLGGAIGIVGALILGQSAVSANLVSPVTLIVVALSGVGNIALPDYDLAFGVRIMKLMFIVFGATMGFVGIAAGCVILLVLLANQESFGVPMLSVQAMKWSAGFPVFRQTPLWRQKLRPRELKAQKERQYPPQARGWDKPRQGDSPQAEE